MSYSLQYVDTATGRIAGFLPNYVNLKLSVQFSDVGVVDLEYLLGGTNADKIADQTEIVISDQLGEIPDTRWIVESGNGNTSSQDGVVSRKWGGRTTWKALGDALVYVPGFNNTYVGDGKYKFVGGTAGIILRAILLQCQSRGELSGYTYTFTDTRDSNGVPWGSAYNVDIETGVSVLQVMQNMVDQGWAEFRVVGREIRAYKPGTHGVDRTTGANQVTLWEGNNTIEVPEQTDSRNLKTVAIVKGDDGVYRELADNAAVAKWGRRAMFISQGGSSDRATLDTVASATLQREGHVKSERTYRYTIGDGAPVPFRDFQVGDWVWHQMRGGIERVRVRQISVDSSAGDSADSCTLTLNDKFSELDIVLARKVAGITGGGDGGGGATPTPTPVPEPEKDPTRDTLAPAAPGAPTLTTEVALDPISGFSMATIRAVWPAVTTNSDGSACNDLDHYEVTWKYDGDVSYGAVFKTGSTETELILRDLGSNLLTDVKVRAVDQWGNFSEWSGATRIRTARDTTPPPIPSALTVANFLGQLRYNWAGTGANGSAMPADFEYTEVHVGTTSTFTPSTATLYDQLPATAYGIYNGSYDTNVWFKARTKDFNGNFSDYSAVSGPFKPTRLVEADVADAAITTAKLKDAAITLAKYAPDSIDATIIRDDAVLTRHLIAGAVTATEMRAGTITAASGILGDLAVTNAKIADAAINNAKIASLAVQDANIANLNVGKLVAGTLQADVLLGARIMTASSGQRVEVSSVGIRQYDSGGNLRTRIEPGYTEIRGAIRATTFYSAGVDTNGSRYIEIGDNQSNESNNDEIRMRNGSYRSSIRSPNDQPGRIRFSMIDQNGSNTIDFDSFYGVITQRIQLSLNFASPTITYSGYEVAVVGNYYGGTAFIGTRSNGHAWFGSNNVGIKCLTSGYDQAVQIRSSNDSSYADLRVRRLGYDTMANDSTRDFKGNITELNIDALDGVRKAKLHVWNWRHEDPVTKSKRGGEISTRDGVGLLVEDLPDTVLRGDTESYDMTALVGYLWTAVQQLDSQVQDLRATMTP